MIKKLFKQDVVSIKEISLTFESFWIFKHKSIGLEFWINWVVVEQ